MFLILLLEFDFGFLIWFKNVDVYNMFIEIKYGN